MHSSPVLTTPRYNFNTLAIVKPNISPKKMMARSAKVRTIRRTNGKDIYYGKPKNSDQGGRKVKSNTKVFRKEFHFFRQNLIYLFTFWVYVYATQTHTHTHHVLPRDLLAA